MRLITSLVILPRRQQLQTDSNFNFAVPCRVCCCYYHLPLHGICGAGPEVFEDCRRVSSCCMPYVRLYRRTLLPVDSEWDPHLCFATGCIACWPGGSHDARLGQLLD
jgi:hypothetical protein